MQLEQWKLIKGYGDRYFVSSHGRIKRKNKFLSGYPHKKRNGYIYISLQGNGERKNWLLHRLVASYFIPNPFNKLCVNHKDFNVSNNFVKNLEWVTPLENMQYSARAGRTFKAIGEKSGNAILKEKIVKKIVRERIKKHISYNQLAKKFKTNYSNIAHIMRGSRWGQITGITYK